MSSLPFLRGGAAAAATSSSTTISEPTVTKKKSIKKKKKKKNTAKTNAKKVIDDAMKEKDAAEAMGDAIRDRADILRQEDPLLQSIDWSVGSVGRALGASDVIMAMSEQGGGVEAPPTSVIANYFLKSHGGAHWLQSALSLLATASAVGAMQAVSTQSDKWTLLLLRRTLLFAMLKHVAGLLASASVAAQAIPKIGLSKARTWMEDIVREPVAQYAFYTALLLLWTPKTLSAVWWWPRHGWVVSLLVAPVLFREVISTALVISDCMVLWSVGSQPQDGVLGQLLNVSQTVVNSLMSLLVGPSNWRSADPAQRQAILAALITKLSLAFEAGVGAFLILDLFLGFLLGMGGGAQRSAWYEALTKLVVVRLYSHYLLWSRKKKLSKLAMEVRGGAAKLPFWILDTLYEPAKALGIDNASSNSDGQNGDGFAVDSMTLKDCIAVGLGL
ncbi:hypothetical protein IV203_021309 [Nitzschia inconspicua]|uniref:Uncharacterized protein n=1 Tax=Nitzschia inconspicua TaxID=303405 RepID=A0A9K3PFV0_9STRA|nr:hypothetical protein IV203_021309 [Nitzschia inconspicua]